MKTNRLSHNAIHQASVMFWSVQLFGVLKYRRGQREKWRMAARRPRRWRGRY